MARNKDGWQANTVYQTRQKCVSYLQGYFVHQRIFYEKQKKDVKNYVWKMRNVLESV